MKARNKKQLLQEIRGYMCKYREKYKDNSDKIVELDFKLIEGILNKEV